MARGLANARPRGMGNKLQRKQSINNDKKSELAKQKAPTRSLFYWNPGEVRSIRFLTLSLNVSFEWKNRVSICSSRPTQMVVCEYGKIGEKHCKLKCPLLFRFSASAYFSSGKNSWDSRYGTFEFELAQYRMSSSSELWNETRDLHRNCW